MKKAFLLSSLITTLSAALAQESFEKTEIVNKPDLKLEVKQNSFENKVIKEDVKEQSSYPYFKIGTTITVQNIGFGYRSHNIEKRRANDVALNLNTILLGLGIEGGKFFPSFKYSYLWYKEPVLHSSYFGLGFEALLFAKAFKTIPNFELFWGKERNSVHFTQFGINVIPAAGIVFFTPIAIFQKNHSKDWAALGAVVSTTLAFSYTIGF